MNKIISFANFELFVNDVPSTLKSFLDFRGKIDSNQITSIPSSKYPARSTFSIEIYKEGRKAGYIAFYLKSYDDIVGPTKNRNVIYAGDSFISTNEIKENELLDIFNSIISYIKEKHSTEYIYFFFAENLIDCFKGKDFKKCKTSSFAISKNKKYDFRFVKNNK